MRASTASCNLKKEKEGRSDQIKHAVMTVTHTDTDAPRVSGSACETASVPMGYVL